MGGESDYDKGCGTGMAIEKVAVTVVAVVVLTVTAVMALS